MKVSNTSHLPDQSQQDQTERSASAGSASDTGINLDTITSRDVFAHFKSAQNFEHDFSELDIYGVLKGLTAPRDPHYPTQTEASLTTAIQDTYGVEGDMIFGQGVKKLWYKVCNELIDQGYEIALPKDIYPRYYDVVNERGIEPTTYTTLEGLVPPSDSPAKSVMVITDPHTYHARSLTPQEMGRVKDWLAENPARRVFIDSVYNYQSKLTDSHYGLLETGQAYYCTSLSKTHLTPKVMGFLVDSTKSLGVQSDITPENATYAHQLITQHTDTAPRQEELFSRCWDVHSSEMTQIDASFQRPKSGYFALLSCPATEVLAKTGSLGLPISITGSSDKTKSMISMAKPAAILLESLTAQSAVKAQAETS